ncbi:MAG: hypothetical protein PVG75_03970 [Thioalkalispiraceae bacterium]|jgi:hypothetical protein
MLKLIKDVLKQMGDGLAFTYAGEMLDVDQKTETLDKAETAPGALPDRVVLAGDSEFTPETMQRAIALCRKKNAMLDLLCVSPRNNSFIDLTATLTYLESEMDLDFQVTRRYGTLMDVARRYAHARRDTLMTLINVSDPMQQQAKVKMIAI